MPIVEKLANFRQNGAVAVRNITYCQFYALRSTLAAVEMNKIVRVRAHYRTFNLIMFADTAVRRAHRISFYTADCATHFTQVGVKMHPIFNS